MNYPRFHRMDDEHSDEVVYAVTVPRSWMLERFWKLRLTWALLYLMWGPKP